MSKKDLKEEPTVPTDETVENIAEETIENTEDQAIDTDLALEKAQTEAKDLKDKYLRLLAEFDNFKKRNVKERIDLMGTAAKDTLTALLPVLDDFDRAQNLSEELKATPAFQEGIQLVYQKLYTILKQRGMEPMESTGLAFDPELHAALTEIPAPSEEMKGKVVDTVERGYTLKGKIIRHAKVVVGK